jgi:2-polyprenyl-3-methyl-5-hydroxy-6-metoxy-1,4-benzoquinol methylase
MPYLFDLTQRHLQPEIMDQPNLDERSHLQALRGLERINRISGSVRILWPAIRELARKSTLPVRILDLGTGGGDVPIGLARKGSRAGVPVEIEGWDISTRAVEYARQKAEQLGVPVRFAVHNALNDALPTDRDVVTCSLFLHHLEEADAVALLRRMGEAARQMVLINDLIRSPAGLLLAHLATRIFTLSRVVHVDGPRSVESAFTMAEARQLAERAGLHGAALQWRWPFRYLLCWRRS